MAASQSKLRFWEPMIHDIEGNSVWIKLGHVSKTTILKIWPLRLVLVENVTYVCLQSVAHPIASIPPVSLFSSCAIILMLIFQHISPSQLIPSWSKSMVTFSLYLMHPASTVRQTTSNIFKFISKCSCGITIKSQVPMHHTYIKQNSSSFYLIVRL